MGRFAAVKRPAPCSSRRFNDLRLCRCAMPELRGDAADGGDAVGRALRAGLALEAGILTRGSRSGFDPQC